MEIFRCHFFVEVITENRKSQCTSGKHTSIFMDLSYYFLENNLLEELVLISESRLVWLHDYFILKLIIHLFYQVRQRSPESRADRYMLMTFEDPPNNIKVRKPPFSWQEHIMVMYCQLSMEFCSQ